MDADADLDADPGYQNDADPYLNADLDADPGYQNDPNADPDPRHCMRLSAPDIVIPGA